MAIAIDADFVYFTTAPPDMCAATAVKRVSKHGGTPEVLVNGVRQLPALAVDDKNVYWSDDPVSLCTQPADPGFAIVMAPKTGGARDVPVPCSGSPRGHRADETDVYWVSWDSGFSAPCPEDSGKRRFCTR
jgi:hypothetical protein